MAARRPIDGALASRIVALDVFAVNVDRTARNPNLLWQGGELWLIDHGAALYWHHGWDGEARTTRTSCRPRRRGRSRASASTCCCRSPIELPAAGAALAAALDDGRIARAVDAVPDLWLEGPGSDRLRAAYGNLAARASCGVAEDPRRGEPCPSVARLTM